MSLVLGNVRKPCGEAMMPGGWREKSGAAMYQGNDMIYIAIDMIAAVSFCFQAVSIFHS